MSTASLQAHQTFFFNIDPNSETFNYSMKTKVTETFGGKVVQLLSVNWDNLSVDFDSGSGGMYGSGREYLKAFAAFFRDAIIWQRDTGNPSIYTHANRGLVVSCYLENLTVQDNLQNVTFPYSIKAKIQQDLMGNLKNQAYEKALARLQDGVGWTKNEYTYLSSKTNQPLPNPAPDVFGGGI